MILGCQPPSPPTLNMSSHCFWSSIVSDKSTKLLFDFPCILQVEVFLLLWRFFSLCFSPAVFCYDVSGCIFYFILLQIDYTYWMCSLMFITNIISKLLFLSFFFFFPVLISLSFLFWFFPYVSALTKHSLFLLYSVFFLPPLYYFSYTISVDMCSTVLTLS